MKKTILYKQKTSKSKVKGFSDEERSAMKERAQELMNDKSNGESAVLSKINAMPEPDRTLARRFHEIVKASAPTLSPKTWYGMPAYAKNGKVVCFFQNAYKFKSRYSTIGFSDEAKLDEGSMWPSSFAIKKLTPSEEKKISYLLKKAVGK